jgi:chromate transport protein ChrA
MPPAATSPTFADAARFWLKLGFVSFGGPAGQIAIMHREVVERRQWLGERDFTGALNFCMLLPGPEALQLAIYLGWKLHGFRGGLVAGLGFIGPAIVLLLGLSWAYARFGHLPAATGVLLGLKAAVLALVLQALLRIGRRARSGSRLRGTRRGRPQRPSRHLAPVRRCVSRWRGSRCGWFRCWRLRLPWGRNRCGAGCTSSSRRPRSSPSAERMPCWAT